MALNNQQQADNYSPITPRDQFYTMSQLKDTKHDESLGQQVQMLVTPPPVKTPNS